MGPLIIYHRGRHGKFDEGVFIEENSLEAFGRAVEEGAEMLEFDVWSDMSVHHEPGATVAPSFGEVLDLLDGRCAINVEIKSPKALSSALSQLEDAYSRGTWQPEQVVLSACHHETALRCKQEMPNVRVGIVNDGVLLPSYIEMLKTKGIDQLHIEWANVYMDQEAGNRMLKSCLENQMPIWVWTVNSLEVFQAVVAYGAEAVFTDRPDLLGKLS